MENPPKSFHVTLEIYTEEKLVGGFNPVEKYARQNGFIFLQFAG